MDFFPVPLSYAIKQVFLKSEFLVLVILKFTVKMFVLFAHSKIILLDVFNFIGHAQERVRVPYPKRFSLSSYPNAK